VSAAVRASAAAWLCAAALALAAPRAADALELGADSASLGEHRRLIATEGVVHLWRPPEYRHKDAGIVIYVHGYFSDVDEAWKQHSLAEQFAKSRENALFIVPDAPVSWSDPVAWPSLPALLRTVERELALPSGPLVIVTHSGGFRTVLGWLGDRRVGQLILLDALYGPETPFHSWLRTGGRAQRKLLMVASETTRKADHFASRYRGAARLALVPDDASQLTDKERQAPLVYMRSQYEHNEIVTSGRVIPLLLQLTPLALR
jgi:hypothetical protein